MNLLELLLLGVLLLVLVLQIIGLLRQKSTDTTAPLLQLRADLEEFIDELLGQKLIVAGPIRESHEQA